MSDLKDLIARGEGESLDFKFRIDDQKKIARTLAAFANTKGGRLLIGVKDSGKITGCDPEEEFYMIEGAANVFCNPPIQIQSQVWQEDHHLVLSIDVPLSETKHKAKDENGEWKFYHRIEDHTLLGNRVTFLLWKYKQDGNQRPEKFDDEVIQLLKLIEEDQPVTISKLFRRSELKKNKINQLLATLIHWNVVEQSILDSGVGYSLCE